MTYIVQISFTDAQEIGIKDAIAKSDRDKTINAFVRNAVQDKLDKEKRVKKCSSINDSSNRIVISYCTVFQWM